MLYLKLMAEKKAYDPTSPTGTVIRIVEADKCAVFNEEELDKAISETAKRFRELRKLKERAKTHSHLTSEMYLKELGVPYTLRPFRVKEG